MPIQIDEVQTQVQVDTTRSADSGGNASQPAHNIRSPRQVEKLIRLLAERILRVQAH